MDLPAYLFLLSRMYKQPTSTSSSPILPLTQSLLFSHRTDPLSVLPSRDPICLRSDSIHTEAVADFPPSYIRVLQALDVGEDLIRVRGVGSSRACQKASGTGEIDPEVPKVGPRGVCEPDIDGSCGFGGGVGLGV